MDKHDIQTTHIPTVTLALCEQGIVLLRPNIHYLFVEIDDCEKCKKIADAVKF